MQTLPRALSLHTLQHSVATLSADPMLTRGGRRDEFFARKDREGVEYPDPSGSEHRYIQANGLR